MAKPRTQYVCSDCGTTTAQWVGKCPGCSEWNTLKEEVVATSSKRSHRHQSSQASKAPRPLKDVQIDNVKRLVTGEKELDRVLGGGVVPGSLMLLGGEPGIGKSTLMLQVAFLTSSIGLKVLYISGEESPEQVRMRASRIGDVPEELMILPETQVPIILQALEQEEYSQACY